MAANRYLYKQATDWSQAASWLTNLGAASAVPVSTDSVYVVDGSQLITVGLNQTAVDLATMVFSNGTKVQVGAAGVPLEISCTGTVYYYAAGGFVFLKAGTANIDSLIIDAPNAQFYLVGGVIDTRIDAYSFIRINDQVGLSAVSLSFWTGSDFYIQYKSDATDPTVTVNGGSGLIERPLTALNVNGGNVTLKVEQEAVAAVTVTVKGDGNFTALRGTITTLDAENATGTVDLSQIVAPLTLTNSTFGPDVKVKGHPLVTFTNPATLKGGRPAAFGDFTGS